MYLWMYDMSHVKVCAHANVYVHVNVFIYTCVWVAAIWKTGKVISPMLKESILADLVVVANPALCEPLLHVWSFSAVQSFLLSLPSKIIDGHECSWISLWWCTSLSKWCALWCVWTCSSFSKTDETIKLQSLHCVCWDDFRTRKHDLHSSRYTFLSKVRPHLKLSSGNMKVYKSTISANFIGWSHLKSTIHCFQSKSTYLFHISRWWPFKTLWKNLEPLCKS